MSAAAFRRATAVVAVAGLTLTGASAASAATDADCAGVTVDGASPTAAADIQALFTASAPLVCLTGTLMLSAHLNVSNELTLHGLPGATIDGGNADAILQTSTADLLTVEGIRFTHGNSVGSSGGAIAASNLLIRNSTFDNNVADYGGAVVAIAITIEDSVFTDNLALGDGGAVFAGDTLTVARSTFSRNNSASDGGAIIAYGVLQINDSTFDENLGTDAGGAFYSGDYYTVENSTFSENHSLDVGGAIFGYGGEITQSTFFENSADGIGSAQSVGNNGTQALGIRGSIFAGPSAEAQVTSAPAVSDLGGNLFTTAQVAEAWAAAPASSTQFALSSAAIFGSNTLADNGGPTFTIAISPTGPAVDAVPGPATLAADQRGVARTTLSDAGAYEIAGPAALAATGSESGWLAALAGGLLGLGAIVRLRRQPKRSAVDAAS